jgi:hypothetical protein
VITVSIAVEGDTDVAAIKKILGSRSISVAAQGRFSTGGKGKLDAKLDGFNNAAAHAPWLVLRDSDQDYGDCPTAARQALLPIGTQNPMMCFRLAVRQLEAWLLADREAFADTFAVRASAIPADVEALPDPKSTLINLCRKSRRSSVRKGMAPPARSLGRVGPEYVTLIQNYARDAWRPEIAAATAPSLARALRQIDRLVAEGLWR